MKFMAGIKAAINRVLPQQSFMRSVGVLAGGTAIAQAIGVVALPLITRIYAPEDFSLLAVFTSMVTILSVSAGLRLEIAIPLPEKDGDAANLLVLALGFGTVSSLLIALLTFMVPDKLGVVGVQEKILPYLWMLPIGVWLAISYSAIQLWATRKKRFTDIAKTRMTQSLGSVMTQLAFGIFAKIGPAGLMLGHLVYCGAGSAGLLIAAWRNDRSAFHSVNAENLRINLKRYRDFPRYSTLEAILSSASTDVPLLIIGVMVVGAEAGFLFLAMKVMIIPLGLVGRAVSNVYLSRAAEENRQGNLKILTINVLDGLVKSGVGPLVFIGIVSPIVVPYVFGQEWHRTGEIIAILTPWFVLQYLSAPISMALHVTGNQRRALALNFIGLLVRAGPVALAAIYATYLVVEAFAVFTALFYIIFSFVLCGVIGIGGRDLLSLWRNNYKNIFIWVLLGVILNSISVIAK